MVRAVHERRHEVDDRVAGQHALGHCLAQALLDGGDVLLWHDATDDLVSELEAGAHLGGGELDDDVPVLAVAPGLPLELVVDAGRLADGLAIGHPRRGGFHGGPELALEPIDDDVDVRVTHGREDRLARAILAPNADRRLLFLEPMQGLSQLVEVGLGLGLDGDLERRRGEVEPGSSMACPLSETSVSPARVEVSLAIAAMSPGPTEARLEVSFPCTARRLPTRSSSRRLTL